MLYFTDQFIRRYHEQSRAIEQMSRDAWQCADCPHPSLPERNVPARIALCRPLPFTSGPFALLNPADYPAVLAHTEGIVAGQGQEKFTIAVPLINETAVGYLLGRGFQMQPFFCRVMTDTPFGNFDHYINTSPMLFL